MNVNESHLKEKFENYIEKKSINEQKKEWSLNYRYRFVNKYRNYFLRLLSTNIKQDWNNVYSLIVKRFPSDIVHILIRWYVKFPDRNGIYKNFFNPKYPIKYDNNSYYVTQDNILEKVNYKPVFQKPKHFKRIKKKIPKKDHLFKYDYEFSTTIYSFEKNEKLVRLPSTISVQTGVDGEKPIITYFSINEFIEWAERHRKTYRIKIYKTYNILVKTFSKESYDD